MLEMKLTRDPSGSWAEVGHERLTSAGLLDDCPRSGGPVQQFLHYYKGISGDQPPPWSGFDVVDVPRAALPVLAVADPVYTGSDARTPDHFLYRLYGDDLRSLIGRNLVGERLGGAMRQRSRDALVEEVADMLATAEPTISRCFLDITGRPMVRLMRGLFPFFTTSGRLEKLVMVTHECARD